MAFKHVPVGHRAVESCSVTFVVAQHVPDSMLWLRLEWHRLKLRHQKHLRCLKPSLAKASVEADLPSVLTSVLSYLCAFRYFLAIPASSWVDDFIDWLNPLTKCCRIYSSGPDKGKFCPSTIGKELCMGRDGNWQDWTN